MSTTGWTEHVVGNEPLLPDTAYRALKRILDLAIVILAMPFALPVMVMCALAIKVEDPSGPVIFTQVRTGRGGDRIRLLKFRTMVLNADELKSSLHTRNELTWPDFKITEDPRVTRVGAVLRKSSLDELPQLFNILSGSLSLVGPRPTSFDASTYQLWQTERLDVKPGLTGLWQVAGRAAMDFTDRARLEIDYVEHRSLLLDFEILAATVPAVLRQKGAH